MHNPKPRMWPRQAIASLSLVMIFIAACNVSAQDDSPLSLESIEIPRAQRQLCFGFSNVSDTNALDVCDALNLDLNVKARELSEQWVRQEPNSPGAQFALADVLLTIEGNMPRALFTSTVRSNLPTTTIYQRR